MDVTEYDGKPFSLLLCGETENGEDDWAVFPGIARVKGERLFLERASGAPDVEIQPEWYNRIKATHDSLRRILQGADYFLPLTVGNISTEDAAGLEGIGIKWPS